MGKVKKAWLRCACAREINGWCMEQRKTAVDITLEELPITGKFSFVFLESMITLTYWAILTLVTKLTHGMVYWCIFDGIASHLC